MHTRKHKINAGRIAEDIANSMGERPLLIPACSIVFMEEIFYRSADMSNPFKYLILSLICMIYSALSVFLMRTCRTAALSVIISMLLLLNSGIVTYGRLNVKAEDTGYFEVTGVVDHTVRRLDGTSEVYIDTDNYGMILWRSEEGEAADPGTTLSVWGRLTVPDTAYDPGQFDYRDYLRRRGILYELKVAQGEAVRTEDSGRMGKIIGSISSYCYRSRVKCLDIMVSEDDDEGRPIAAALFMGDKSLLDTHIRSDFSKTGCSHLIAVSGTHYAGFLMMMPPVLQMIGVSSKKSIPIYVLFCLGIGFFTGWSESVTRAAVMSMCAYVMRDMLSGMSMAALIMGIADPFTLLGNAFRMSFASGIAILLLTKPLYERIGVIVRNDILNKLLSVYIAVRAGMLPFAEETGLILTPEAVFSQIIGGVLAQFACAMFIPSVLAALIFSVNKGVMTSPCMIPARAMLRIVAYSAEQTDVSNDVIRLSGIAYCITAGVIIVVLLPRSLFRKGLRVIVAVVIAIYGVSCITGYINRPDATIVFIDVGQGDSCLIMSEGRSCLIDCGPPGSAASCLIPVLDYYGIASPDIVLISHWDMDHAGGLKELIDNGRCDGFFASYAGSDDQTRLFFDEVFGITEEAEVQDFLDRYVTVVEAGDDISIGSKVEIDILHPYHATDGENPSSMVALADISGTRVLFTGDIDADTERELTTQEIIPDIDILKAAHHGSAYSSCEEFLDAARPELTVISAGRGNVYGHPARSTLERLHAVDSAIMTTAVSGAVIVKIYDDGYTYRGYV